MGCILQGVGTLVFGAIALGFQYRQLVEGRQHNSRIERQNERKIELEEVRLGIQTQEEYERKYKNKT